MDTDDDREVYLMDESPLDEFIEDEGQKTALCFRLHYRACVLYRNDRYDYG